MHQINEQRSVDCDLPGPNLMTVVRLAVVAALITALCLPTNSYASEAGCGSDSRSTLHGSTDPGAVSVSGECAIRTTDLPGVGGLPVVVIDCGYATATDDHT